MSEVIFDFDFHIKMNHCFSLSRHNKNDFVDFNHLISKFSLMLHERFIHNNWKIPEYNDYLRFVGMFKKRTTPGSASIL